MELFHGKTFDSNGDWRGGERVALGSSAESDSSPLPLPLRSTNRSVNRTKIRRAGRASYYCHSVISFFFFSSLSLFFPLFPRVARDIASPGSRGREILAKTRVLYRNYSSSVHPAVQ